MRYALFPSDFGIHKWGGKLKFIILCYFNSKNFSMIIPYNFLLLSVITLQRIPIHRSFIFNRKWRSDILSSLYDQWFFFDEWSYPDSCLCHFNLYFMYGGGLCSITMVKYEVYSLIQWNCHTQKFKHAKEL